MKNRIDNSRKKTPWDKREDKTTLQKFIEEKYVENYNLKHPKLIDTDEAKIINNVVIERCKICSSTNIAKKGKTKNGIQMYFCKDCKKRFTPLKNTIFENHRISITEWIEFLLDLFNYGSTTLTSKVNKNALNTSIYWFHKVFLVLQNWQDDIILEGNIYIDEMFYSAIKSDLKIKDKKKLRGFLAINIVQELDTMEITLLPQLKVQVKPQKTKQKLLLCHILNQTLSLFMMMKKAIEEW